MKSFKEYTNLTESLIKDLFTESNLTQNDFIKSVSKYASIDQALDNLPDKYTEFYIQHINDPKLNKELKRLKLIENWNTEVGDYNVGTSPKPYKIKRLHYKGQYIVLDFNPQVGWVPYIAYRNITSALKYVKDLYDEFN